MTDPTERLEHFATNDAFSEEEWKLIRLAVAEYYIHLHPRFDRSQWKEILSKLDGYAPKENPCVL